MRNIYIYVYRLCFRLCSIFLPIAVAMFHHTTYTKSTIQSSSEHQGNSSHLWEHPVPSPVLSPEGLRGKKTPSESETARRWRLENQGCSAVQWVQRKDGSRVPTVPITTVTIRWISRLGISHYIIPFGWRVADFLKPRLGMVYCCTTLP